MQMQFQILGNLAVIAKTRTKKNVSHNNLIKTGKSLYWLIDVNETIFKIDRELQYIKKYGDLEKFHAGLSYSEYLKKLRSFIL